MENRWNKHINEDIMKKIIFTSFISLAVFVSCEDIVNVHNDYVDGEVVYAPMTGNPITFLGGLGRIEANCIVSNGVNLKSIDFSWNNGESTYSYDVEGKCTTGIDTLKIMLENMPEGSYSFTVKTKDVFGNQSLPTEGIGTSYGDDYASSVKVATLSDYRDGEWDYVENANGGVNGNVYFTSYPAGSTAFKTEIQYQKSDGTLAVETVSGNSLKLNDFKPGTYPKTRSYNKPEENAIDEVVSDWRESSVPLPYVYRMYCGDWTAKAIGYYNDNMSPDKAINDNTDDYWGFIDPEDNDQDCYPHWLIIDLGRERQIEGFNIYNDEGSEHDGAAYIGNSDNPNGAWENIWTGLLDTGWNHRWTWVRQQTCLTGMNKKARYLKVEAISPRGNDLITCIYEVYVFHNAQAE